MRPLNEGGESWRVFGDDTDGRQLGVGVELVRGKDDSVARSVMSQPRILTGEEARFLRKAVLGLTQDRLAKHMHINTITIADWERGERPLSTEHDYELRGVALMSVLMRLRSGVHLRLEILAEDLSRILTAPRTLAPPLRAKRYVVRAAELPAA
jgi:DNA-binding transcriptional regulator YiaG